MKKLEILEAQLSTLIEEHLLKALPGSKPEIQITRQLAAAMRSSIKSQQDGCSLAPNLYVIVTHPSSLPQWQGKPGLLEELLNALIAAGSETGLHFSSSPTLTTAADISMEPDKVRILTSFSGENLAETRGIRAKKDGDINSDSIPGNAFLIIQGASIFPLKQSVINIGRRLDNHIVIDDPRVSRNHAQLRAVRGQFMLFDLNSTGGTFVNNERTTKSFLHPGDVISLAGVLIIFGQDLPLQKSEPSVSDTTPSSVDNKLQTTFIPGSEDRSK